MKAAIAEAEMNMECGQLFNQAAELGLIMAVVSGAADMTKLIATIRPEYFPLPRYQTIYTVACEVFRRATAVGITPACDVLSMCGTADAMGLGLTRQQVSQMTDDLVGYLDAAKYRDLSQWPVWAEQLREAAAKRWLYSHIRQTQLGLDTTGLLDTAAAFREVAERLERAFSPVTSTDMGAAWDAYRQTDRSRWVRLDAFSMLTEAIGGHGYLQPGAVSVITGRSGLGKSRILTSITTSLIGRGVPVLHIDSELGHQAMSPRFVGAKAGIRADAVHLPEHAAALAAMDDEMRRDWQYLDYRYMPTDFHGVIPAVREFGRRTGGRGVVIVDWLRPTFEFGNHRNEWEKLGAMMTALKEVAVAAGVHVFAACQENRAAIGVSIADRLHGGEQFVGGSDRITHLADNVLSFVNVGDELRGKMAAAGLPVIPHSALITAKARLGTVGAIMPLMAVGGRLEQVTDPEVVRMIATSATPQAKHRKLVGESPLPERAEPKMKLAQ